MIINWGSGTIELPEDSLGDCLYVVADDDYYNGRIPRKEALKLAQAILDKWGPKNENGDLKMYRDRALRAESRLESIEEAVGDYRAERDARDGR